MTDIAIYVDISPDFTAEAIVLLTKYRGAIARDEGNAGVIVLRETSRQNRFVVVEAWNTDAAFQTHEAAPHTVEFRSRLRAIHNSPYDQRAHHTFAAGSDQAEKSDSLLYVV